MERMTEQYSRTELIIGKEGIEKLKAARVAVFGIGGVGGYVCEALARGGIGAFDLIDKDTVAETDINRQITALHSTLGRPKCEVMKERIEDISGSTVIAYNCFFLPGREDEFPWHEYDYIIDAVDNVTAKVALAVKAENEGIPIISSMGAGNKMDPTAFRVADIYETSVCPLAKVMRHELRKRGVKGLKTVFSTEKPVELKASSDVPASISFVPSVCGLVIAGEVIKDILGR